MTSRVLRVAVFSLIFVAGVLLLFEFFAFDNWKTLSGLINGFQKAPDSRLYAGIVAVIFLVIPLTAFHLWNRRRLRLASFCIPSTVDPVFVRLTAIAEFVRGIALEHPGVEDARVLVHRSGPGVDIDLTVTLFTGEELLALTTVLGKAVREAMREKLGIHHVTRMSVVVQSVTDSRML